MRSLLVRVVVGVAAGADVGLALAGDFVIAARSARFDLIKHQVDAAWSSSAPSALDDEATLQSSAFVTEDMREGAAAFLERRPPRFSGR